MWSKYSMEAFLFNKKIKIKIKQQKAKVMGKIQQSGCPGRQTDGWMGRRKDGGMDAQENTAEKRGILAHMCEQALTKRTES